MAKGTGATANFTSEIDNWLNDIGEDTLLFKKGDSPIEEVKNKYIEIFRKALEEAKRPKGKGHIGSTRELYSSLGEGWKIERSGKSVSLILELPEYYYYTDKGRGATSAGGDGAVRKGLAYQSSSLKGWIAAKGLVPSSGMEFKYKRKLSNGTVKTYTRKLNAKDSNRALSFMISKKIHEQGYVGSNWFSKLLPQFEADMTEAIQKEFGDDTDFNIDIITR